MCCNAVRQESCLYSFPCLQHLSGLGTPRIKKDPGHTDNADLGFENLSHFGNDQKKNKKQKTNKKKSSMMGDHSRKALPKGALKN